VGNTVILERERENSYDTNAIRVRLDDGADVGYVARDAARGLASRLDTNPDAFHASVREIDLTASILRLELRAR
jgi:HIRAN domain